MNKNNQKDMSNTKDNDYSPFTVTSLLIVVAMFFCFFFGWIYIFNFDAGVTEIGMNGWNFICLSFCWKFKSIETGLFGNVYSFNYHEPEFIIALTIMTMIVFYMSLALLILVFYNIKKNSIKVTRIITLLSFVDALMLLACFIVGLLLNVTALTRGEFCDNPACSTGSLAIIPAVVAFGNGLLNHFFRHKLLADKDEQIKIVGIYIINKLVG